MVKYQYEAWGRWLNQATATKTSIGTTLLSLNPFLYKGYIYDEESGFYYLKSRYYSPEVRRFINVDSEVGDVGNLENYNLFAYCNNNPVMLTDSTGCSPFWDSVGNWFKDHWKEIAIGAAFIIVGALVTALTAGAGVGFMAAFGSALLSSTIQVGISMAVSVVIGGLISVATGGNFFDNFGDNLASGFMWGGIFSGGAQIVGGAFRAAANAGATTGRNAGISLGKTGIKILSPDANTWAKAGGTLVKFGKYTRLDVGAHYGLHLHTILNSAKWLPAIIKHFPIGAMGAGIIGAL